MHLPTTLATLVSMASVGTAQLTKVNDFPGTPTRLGMYVNVPKNLKTPAPIVVAVHHCQGSATGYSGSTKYVQLSNQYGFIAIYPNSKSGGGCFDVASQASELSLSFFNPPKMKMRGRKCGTNSDKNSPHPQWRR